MSYLSLWSYLLKNRFTIMAMPYITLEAAMIDPVRISRKSEYTIFNQFKIKIKKNFSSRKGWRDRSRQIETTDPLFLPSNYSTCLQRQVIRNENRKKLFIRKLAAAFCWSSLQNFQQKIHFHFSSYIDWFMIPVIMKARPLSPLFISTARPAQNTNRKGI